MPPDMAKRTIWRDTQGRIVRCYTLRTDIDDRKALEEALRASELNLRLIVDTIPQFITVIDAEERVVDANPLLLKYIGWSLEEPETNDLPEIIFHPDDLKDFAMNGKNCFDSMRRRLILTIGNERKTGCSCFSMSPITLSQVYSCATYSGPSQQVSGALCNAIWWASSC